MGLLKSLGRRVCGFFSSPHSIDVPFLFFLLDLRFGCSVHVSIVLEMHEIMSFRGSACGLYGKWR